MIQCIADPNSPACAYMGLAILFFWFSQCFLGFWPKVLKTSRNPKKKQKNTKLQTLTHQLVPTWVLQFCFFCFFCFFWFSQCFLGFWPKVLKTSRNPKKTKKNKIADPNSPACTYMGLAILFFLFFFGFLNVFLVFDPKYSKPREIQKKQKKNCRP